MIILGRHGYAKTFGSFKEVVSLVVGHKEFQTSLASVWDFWEVLEAALENRGEPKHWEEGGVTLTYSADVLTLEVNKGQSRWSSLLQVGQMRDHIAVMRALCERVEPFERCERVRCVALPFRCVSPSSTSAAYTAAWEYLRSLQAVDGPLPRYPEHQILRACDAQGLEAPYRYRR